MTRAFWGFNKKRGGQTFDTIEENPEEMRTSSNFKGLSIEGSLNREEKALQMSPKSTQSLDFFGTSTKDQEKCKNCKKNLQSFFMNHFIHPPLFRFFYAAPIKIHAHF